MSDDRELLELAKKASGESLAWHEDAFGSGFKLEMGGGYSRYWNPLNDDGDAFRLAVKLRLLVDVSSSSTKVTDGTIDGIIEMHRINRSAEVSTRRAIVRAAAEIGRQITD